MVNSNNIVSEAGQFDKPGAAPWHKAVGISLAIASSFFIGASFVLKKKGLLDSNAAKGSEPGVGHAYLKNPMWWTGMILMLGGEICNLVAYAFSPAVLVTPLGAMSVVISATLSSIFLKERLSFSAKVGCGQCVVGAIIIVLYTPATTSTSTIPEFMSYVINPVFLIYSGVMAAIVALFILVLDPRYGTRWPLVDILICSILGSFVVISTQGFGSAIVYSFSNPNDNQFLHWEIYPLIAFVIGSAISQIHYLNKALNIFSTAVITPIYYVCFTTMTLIGSAVLFRDVSFESLKTAITAFLGFVVIVGGVVLLFQYSLKLSKRARMLQEALPLPTNDSTLSLSGDVEIKAKISPRTISLYASRAPSTASIATMRQEFSMTRNSTSSSKMKNAKHVSAEEFEDALHHEYNSSITSPGSRKRGPSGRIRDSEETSPIVAHAAMPAGHIDQTRARLQQQYQQTSPTQQLEGLIMIPDPNQSHNLIDGFESSGSTYPPQGTVMPTNTTKSNASYFGSLTRTASMTEGDWIQERRTSKNSISSTRNAGRGSWGLLTMPAVDVDEML